MIAFQLSPYPPLSGARTAADRTIFLALAILFLLTLLASVFVTLLFRNLRRVRGTGTRTTR